MTPSRFTVDPHVLDNTDLSKVAELRHWQHQISVLLEQLQNGVVQLPPTPSSSVFLDGTGNWSTPSAGAGGGGDMTKVVYDTNNNGVVDTCDSLAYSRLTGVPVSFSPSTHAPTHLDNGGDPIPVVTTARTGLVPTLPNDSTRFLNGTGTWTAVAGGSTGDTFEYRWDTGTSAADPGSGYVRSNNANPLSASGVYISYYDRAGVFVVDISRLKSGDTFYIYPTGNATQWVRYQLSANPIDHASWYELAVSVLEPNGFAPGANASVQVAFPVKPAAHASTHIDNGIDPIPVVTSTRTGLTPKLSGSSAQFLNGTGVFSTPSVGAPPSSLTDLGSPAGNSTINTAQAFLVAVNLKWTTAANWTLILQNVVLGSTFYLRLLNNSGASRTFTITATNPSATAYTVTVLVPGSAPLSGAIAVSNGNALNVQGVSYTVGGNPTIQLFGFGSTG
jgi:hypothetical protein